MPSIGVLEHFQKVTDQPTRRVKRSGGQSLVNRGLAYWLKENVLLKMHSPTLIKPFSLKEIAQNFNQRAYIPEKLPANIDYQLGLVIRAPILANQVRFRAIADPHSSLVHRRSIAPRRPRRTD